MNPLKVTKRYLLTTRKDDGSYEPMNDEEFETFMRKFNLLSFS